MANPNPYAARLALRRARKPGAMQDVLLVLWTAVRDAERLLYEAEDPSSGCAASMPLARQLGNMCACSNQANLRRGCTPSKRRNARREGTAIESVTTHTVRTVGRHPRS